jgi:very-short-patch-repair endonuclease
VVGSFWFCMRVKRNPASESGGGAGVLDPRIAELARKQHGVVGIHQLMALGLRRSAVGRRLRAGRLHRLHAGVYAVGHRHLSRRGLWMAAVLACGDGALLSHRSAAVVWAMVSMSPSRIDVTVPRRRSNGRRKGPPGIAIHRPRTLEDCDCTHRWGIPITTPTRTLVDLGSVLSPTQLKNAFEEAEGKGILNRARLAHLCMASSGRRGSGTLRALLAARPLPLAETRSRLEQRFLRFCRERGLPIPAVNVPLAGYNVDCLWPEQRVVVELDSWAHHGDRASFESDRRRDTRIQIAGHCIVRVTSRRISHEADLLEAELRTLLGLAGNSPPPR